MRDSQNSAALSRLPKRAQSALNDQLSVAREYFTRRVGTAIAAVEEQLFKRAEKSINNNEQQQLLTAIKEIKAQREAVAARVMELLAARIENYGDPVDDGDQAKRPSERMGLSLMAKKSQDESVVLESFATRVEGHAALALFELGHRYAVLAGAPVFESPQQPFSPAAVCACIRQGTASLKLSDEHRLELYQAFDRDVLQGMVGLYDTLNKRLIEHGILPNLRRFALKRRTPSTRHQFAASSGAEHGSAEAEGEVSGTTPAEAREAQSDNSQAKTYQDVMQLLAFRRAPTDDMLSGLPPRPQQSARTVAPVSGEQGIDTQGVSGTPTAPTQADLNRVLGMLQQQAAARPTSPSAPQAAPTIQELRQAMLSQLGQDKPGTIPTLTQEQSNIMDLMTMVFDRLSTDVHAASENHLLRELQAPLLRVAMTDQSFFTNQQHAARNWLEKVAEAVAEWNPDAKSEDGDASLMERIQDMNHAIGRDFDGDLTIFDKMVGDLQKQIDQLARRAAVIEKRYVEVARGRERLDLARQQAEELVNERINLGEKPSLGRTLFQHAWTDVLTLTLLRQGEDSPEFQRNLKIAEVLGKGMPDVTPEKASLMRRSVAQILMQVGFEAKEAILLVNEITNNRRASLKEEGVNREEDVEAELEHKLKSHKPVGHEQQTQDDRIAAVVIPPGTEEGEKVLAAIEQIKQQPFGTWFEFDEAEGADPVRRRMAWFSTRTGRCLFVNRNGVRSHDTTLRHVAEAMVAGKARVAQPVKAGFFARIMDKIHDGLKKMGTGEMPEGQAI